MECGHGRARLGETPKNLDRVCACVLAMGTQLCWVWGEPVSDGHGQALPVACGRTPSHLWVGDKDTIGCSAAQGSFLGDMTSCGAAGRGLRSRSSHHSLQ